MQKWGGRAHRAMSNPSIDSLGSEGHRDLCQRQSASRARWRLLLRRSESAACNEPDAPRPVRGAAREWTRSRMRGGLQERPARLLAAGAGHQIAALAAQKRKQDLRSRIPVWSGAASRRSRIADLRLRRRGETQLLPLPPAADPTSRHLPALPRCPHAAVASFRLLPEPCERALRHQRLDVPYRYGARPGQENADPWRDQ